MDTMIEILEREIAAYAGEGLNGSAYFVVSPDRQVYAVNDVFHTPEGRFVDVSLLVRRKGDCIIIEHDISDKMLVDALMQAGIPRDHIVLAYAGEKFEEAA